MDDLEPALPLKKQTALQNWISLTLDIKLTTAKKNKVIIILLKLSKITWKRLLLITVFPSFNTARWVKFCYQLLKKLLLITMFPSFNTTRWVKQVFKSIFIRREYLPKYLSRFSLLLCCWFGIQRWTELIHSRMSLFIGKAGSRKCI